MVLQQNLLDGSQDGVMGRGVIGNTAVFGIAIQGSSPCTPTRFESTKTGVNMGKTIQMYFVLSVVAIVLFVASYQATMHAGDFISRFIF